MYITVSPISSRNQFGWLLTSKKLLGDAVEIGTHRGEFAKILKMNWQGRLYCIDPWKDIEGYESQAEMLKEALGGNGNRDDDFLAAKDNLARWRDKVLYIRSTSLQSVNSFTDNSLDFVYIDGDHREEFVYQDIVQWYKKVKVGGLLAGHDFIMPGEVDGGWGKGIQAAVTKFTNLIDIPVHLIIEENNQPFSYYLVKE